MGKKSLLIGFFFGRRIYVDRRNNLLGIEVCLSNIKCFLIREGLVICKDFVLNGGYGFGVRYELFGKRK